MAAESEGLAGICLFGPTGTGKSDIALQLAEQFAVEIISVDSAMVYRHMDIGTAKPGHEIRERIPHHLVDIREPWQSFSAGEFRTAALDAMAAIRGRGRIPLLVGGTMLYFRALASGLVALPPADARIRAAIDLEAAERGWPALHGDLERLDPLAAARIRPGDRQRIQRALEVLRITGQPISDLHRDSQQDPKLQLLRIGLLPADRMMLYRQLDRRFSAMLQAGLLGEVTRLRAMPQMSAACPAMRAVGYRQLWAHLSGDVSRAEAERQAVVATHRLAKRQLTWLRSEAMDLAVDPFDSSARAAIARALVGAGVSRCGQLCNMMVAPECRETRL